MWSTWQRDGCSRPIGLNLVEIAAVNYVTARQLARYIVCTGDSLKLSLSRIGLDRRGGRDEHGPVALPGQN